jgi:NAD+ synthase (glutamine-hydrolysing)
MKNDKLLIAVAQMAPKLGDLESNLESHLRHVEYAAELGVSLIVFPELSLTGYTLKDLAADVAQRVGDSDFIKAVANASREVSIIAGFVEDGDDFIFYNSAAYFEGGRILDVHRKVYLPTYGMFDEERYFSPGSDFRAFDTAIGRTAILICEDYWHPSSVYLAAQDGAVIHAYVSNAPLRGLTLPDEITSADIAERMALVSSQLYGVYTIYANRVGYEDGVAFAGGSRVFSPTGGVIARADHQEEELLVAEIDAEQVRRARVFFPLIGDEKLDLVHRELTRIRNRRFRLEEEKEH